MPQFDSQFLMETFFTRCTDSGRHCEPDHSEAKTLCATARIDQTRPFLVRSELILNGQILGDYLDDLCVEQDTLLEVCFKIFKDTCKKPDKTLRQRHVLASVGYLALRFVSGGIKVVKYGRPIYWGRNPSEEWETVCCIMWGALCDLQDEDTLVTWLSRLNDYEKPLP